MFEDAEVIEGARHAEEAIASNRSTGVIGLIVLLVVAYFLYQWIFTSKWTLLVCEDLVNPCYRYECSDIAIPFRDQYKNLEECTIAGSGFLDIYPGYECWESCDFNT